MAIAFAEDVTTTVAKLLGVIKEKILASSDWAHLSVATSVTVATSSIAAGATSGTASASVATGAVMTFWRANTDNGAATPEVRVNTGGGTSAITWTDALVAPLGSYLVGDKIGIGSYVKATTTTPTGMSGGAQMVVDFADAAITAQRIQAGIYRTHDGTTGVDKVTRFLYWKNAVGATADIVRATVSASKDLLYVAVEGPRASETNATSASLGSEEQCLILAAIVPYYGTSFDNVPSVALIGNETANASVTPATSIGARRIMVNRDASNANSWVTANLLTLAQQSAASGGTQSPAGVAPRPTWQAVGLDGTLNARPWVVDEDIKGLRGTLKTIFNGGSQVANPTYADPQTFLAGQEVTYGGVTYRAVTPFRQSSTSGNRTAYGFGDYFNFNAQTDGPILLVPKA